MRYLSAGASAARFKGANVKIAFSKSNRLTILVQAK